MKRLILFAQNVLTLSLVCSNLFAEDGTLTINGSIVDETCTLQLNMLSASDVKALSARLKTAPNSQIYSSMGVTFLLTDTTGTAVCDVAKTKAFKGIHLSPNVAVDLDTRDTTLLVSNTLAETSTKSPVFIQVLTDKNKKVDFSAPWETQAKSVIDSNFDAAKVYYTMQYFSNKGAIDAQSVTTLINYTLHYN